MQRNATATLGEFASPPRPVDLSVARATVNAGVEQVREQTRARLEEVVDAHLTQTASCS